MQRFVVAILVFCLWSACYADDTLTVVAHQLWSVHFLLVDSADIAVCHVLNVGQSDTVYTHLPDPDTSASVYDDLQFCCYEADFPGPLSECTGYGYGIWTENLTYTPTTWILFNEYPQLPTDPTFEFPCMDHGYGLLGEISQVDSGETCAYFTWNFEPGSMQRGLVRDYPNASGIIINLHVPGATNFQVVDSVILYWLVPTADAGETRAALPTVCTLAQNYPNPFNPVTEIPFTLPRAMNTSLRVYDLLGREVAVLANGVLSPGTHTARFGSPSLPSGVYVYRLEAGGQMETKKMVMMK